MKNIDKLVVNRTTVSQKIKSVNLLTNIKTQAAITATTAIAAIAATA